MPASAIENPCLPSVNYRFFVSLAVKNMSNAANITVQDFLRLEVQNTEQQHPNLFLSYFKIRMNRRKEN